MCDNCDFGAYGYNTEEPGRYREISGASAYWRGAGEPRKGIKMSTNDRIVYPKLKKKDFKMKEAINSLRGNIQMAGYNVKVIAITSANAGEGKSHISFELACSLADLRKRTLYLDCDIRKSKTKERYGIVEKTEGLSEFLCGQVSKEDIIYKTDNAYMDIIFSGKRAPNPSELLSEELFKNLISELKSEYDYIIVDTPPADIVIDAQLISRYCDTVLLVVRWAVTDRRAVMRVRSHFESMGIKIMGVVLNRISQKAGYGYGKYGYKKYGYDKYGYEKYE